MTVKKSAHLTRRAMVKASTAALLSPALLPQFAAAETGSTLNVLSSPSAVRKEGVEMFKEKTGITLRAAPYVSPTNTMGKLLSGSAPYDAMITLSDLVRPSLKEAVGRGVLHPIDLAKVPNSKDIGKLFDNDIMKVDSNAYSVPIYWGFNPVLYNRKFIKDGDPLTDSYKLLLDDRYKGVVSIRDDAHESMHMTALCLGHKNPSEMDASDIKEVTKFLISKKGNFRALWSKFAEAVQLMASGEVHAMFGWLLMRKTLQAQGFDVVSNHPKEGLLWWVHAAFIPATSHNVEGAHIWINFLVSPEFGHKLSEISGVPSTSQAAKNSFSKDLQKKYGYDELDNGPMVKLAKPKHLDLWLEAWSQFKAA
jgi:spermidine/putrescine transport system substrate-binding protein